MFMLQQKLSTKIWWKINGIIFKYTQIFWPWYQLLLQRGVYPYTYMDDLEKLNETSLPEKVDFHSHLNMEHNTDAG